MVKKKDAGVPRFRKGLTVTVVAFVDEHGMEWESAKNHMEQSGTLIQAFDRTCWDVEFIGKFGGYLQTFPKSFLALKTGAKRTTAKPGAYRATPQSKHP